MSSAAMARRSDVRNSLTEKCENCTTRALPSPTTVIKLEQVDNTARSWSSRRQSAFNEGIPPGASSKSNASTSASSSRRRGRTATVRHCKRRCAYARVAWLMFFKMQSYVSSSDSGSSRRIRRRLGGKQCRRVSSWQKTHRNLR